MSEKPEVAQRCKASSLERLYGDRSSHPGRVAVPFLSATPSCVPRVRTSWGLPGWRLPGAVRARESLVFALALER